MQQSDRPFREALDELRGARTLAEVAHGVEDLALRRDANRRTGASRSSFEKHAAGTARGSPSRELLERVAEVLRTTPDYFSEYRLFQARAQLDEATVGHDAAMAALDRVKDLLIPPAAPPRARLIDTVAMPEIRRRAAAARRSAARRGA